VFVCAPSSAFQRNSNIIHGSDSVESANRELALWFKAEELLTWDLHAKVDIYH
jgi:nucleoside-diphosphate kinase